MRNLLLVLVIAGLVPKALSLALDTPHPLATITSSSMWPELKRGDLVLIRSVSPEEVEPGMIVAFVDEVGGGFIIHRVVEVQGQRIITKGDANEQEDPPVETDTVVGAVPTIRGAPLKAPYLGYITLAARG